MRASIAAATKQKAADLLTALIKAQVTVAAAKEVVAYIPGTPTGNATFVAAIATANAGKISDIFVAEQSRQGVVAVAKDLLRSQGEIAF